MIDFDPAPFAAAKAAVERFGEEMTVVVAKIGGAVAFHAGRPLSTSPHALASAPWRAWREGWIATAKETVKRETSATSGRSRGHGVDWTPGELALLARLVADPRLSPKEVAGILGRTPAAVRVKACRLRKLARAA